MDHKQNAQLDIANHILPTAANLLGICFILLGFIRVNGLGPSTVLDELLTIPILFFFMSAIFSYLSLRRMTQLRFYETWADKMFIVGLLSLTLMSVFFVLEIVK